jgi:hypothetical protein
MSEEECLDRTEEREEREREREKSRGGGEERRANAGLTHAGVKSNLYLTYVHNTISYAKWLPCIVASSYTFWAVHFGVFLQRRPIYSGQA